MFTSIRLNSQNKAILLGISASTSYAAAYVLLRLLGSGHLHSVEVVFFRTLVCFLAICTISVAIGRGGFRTRRPGLILARGVLSAIGLLLWFHGLMHLPLAEALALSLTTICFTSVGAALFLGEPVTARRAWSIVLALAGALFIVKPGFGTFKLEYLVVIGSAACWGGAACLVRSTARTEDPYTIVLWTTLVILIFSAAPTAAVWRPPAAPDLAILTGIGILSALGMVLWTNAFRHAEASLVVVTDFVQIAWGVLIGMMFGEFPPYSSFIGIGLIVGSVLIPTMRMQKPKI